MITESITKKRLKKDNVNKAKQEEAPYSSDSDSVYENISLYRTVVKCYAKKKGLKM